MKFLKLTTLLLLSFVITSCYSQMLLPKNYPNPNSRGYYKIGYIQPDSGILFTSRDTNWHPKYPALVLWLHTGVDTSLWLYDKSKWKFAGGTGGSGVVIWGLGFPTYDTRYALINHTQSFSTITSKPTTLSGYGITDPVVLITGLYSNPSFINSIAWNKITSRPTTLSGYGISDPIALTTNSYANPVWITSLAWNKISGTPTTASGYGITDALAISVADARYPQLSSTYSNPSWLTALAWSKVTSTPTTLSGYGITDGLTQSFADARYPLVGSTYNNPSFINTLSWAKIISTPTTISGYGITDGITLTAADSRYPQLSSTYSNPSWITGLAWSKISATPTTVSGYGITDALGLSTGDARYPLLSNSYSNPSWITGLAWSKILSTPTTTSGYGITDAEVISNKATSLSSPDNIKFPTTQAVVTALGGYVPSGTISNLYTVWPLYSLNDSTFKMNKADHTHSGFLDSTDWDRFNAAAIDTIPSPIQFQDEGSNLGSVGTVTAVNFTGSGVSASRTGNTVTINVTGGGSSGGTIATISSVSLVNTGTYTIDLTPYTGYNQIKIEGYNITTNLSGDTLYFETSADNSTWTAGTYVYNGGNYPSIAHFFGNLRNSSTDNNYFELTVQRPEVTTMWPRIKTYVGYEDSGNNSIALTYSWTKQNSESVRYIRLSRKKVGSGTITIPLIEIRGY